MGAGQPQMTDRAAGIGSVINALRCGTDPLFRHAGLDLEEGLTATVPCAV